MGKREKKHSLLDDHRFSIPYLCDRTDLRANDFFANVHVLRARNTATKKPGHDPGFLGLRHLHSTAVWPTELVRAQYLRITEIGDARIIVEKLHCNLIRDLYGHIPSVGEHLNLYI